MNQSHQFHIHWRNHSPNFVSVFTQLLNSESLVDVTLSADGKQIQAHRVVLSACSNYFQELFISHPCQHPIVILKDVKYEDLCTIIHFMYYGEVNFAQEHLDSVLKTAEILQVKGFPDAVSTENFSSALAKSISVTPSTSPSLELDENEIGPKRKRMCSTSNSNTCSSSQSPAPPLTKSQESPHSTESRPPSIRSMSSCESNSVIKEKSSLTEQNSTELASGSFSRDDADESSSNTATNGKTSSTSWTTPTRTNLNGSASLDSGTDGSMISAKAKRNRPLIRQQCVKKDNEKESHGIGEDNQSPPATTSTLQPILPKTSTSVPTSETSGGMSRARGQTFLQLPQTSQLPRQRSQPILPSQSTTYSTPTSSPSPVGSGNSSNVQPISFLPANIPTLAVTPVSSSSNIVIEPFPTILRVVSFEDVNSGGFHEFPPSTPVLTRASSQTTPNSTLQVPTTSDTQFASSSQGMNRLKAKVEDSLRRSVSNPGISTSHSSGTSSNRSGHCPELRTGAALGCNYCWNTVDNHGRILRRKTKYHCPDCQANLCIVPCFQEFHEKSASGDSGASTSGTGGGGTSSKGSTQQLSKMSSI